MGCVKGLRLSRFLKIDGSLLGMVCLPTNAPILLFHDEFHRSIEPKKKKKGKKEREKKITSKSKMETVGEGINRATLHA